jgi:FixJ family two-component response regulator
MIRSASIYRHMFGEGEASGKMVIVIDDDDSVRNALKELLRSAGLSAQTFASAEEFLDSGQHRNAGCLIADIRMPGMSGLELQAKLNADRIRIPTIFITAHGDEKMRMQALRAGAVEFVTKPFDDEALLETVRAALDG